MVQELKLEDSLKDFAIAVERLYEKTILKGDLLEEYLLARAQDATIKSIWAMKLFDNAGLNPRIETIENANFYNGLIRKCLKRFHQIMPSLDGQGRYVELFGEHMRGRLELVSEVLYRGISYS